MARHRHVKDSRWRVIDGAPPTQGNSAIPRSGQTLQGASWRLSKGGRAAEFSGASCADWKDSRGKSSSLLDLAVRGRVANKCGSVAVSAHYGRAHQQQVVDARRSSNEFAQGKRLNFRHRGKICGM